jgi:dihydrodipicolinate synthase/N-acetylneuraminate lyase
VFVGDVNPSPSLHYWSAAPTPLNSDLSIDTPSLERMIHAAIADGLTGLFLAGTCGEGPWLPNRERIRLVEAGARIAAGRLKIAAQVSDNSVPRILDNIRDMAGAGADYAVISHPAVMFNPTPERIAGLFEEAVAASPLPVGIYDLGARRAFAIPEDRLKAIYLMPNVRLIKDSSNSPTRRTIALSARSEKPSIQLFNGDEFQAIAYLEAGYDGCMFGGAAAVAPMMRQIGGLVQAGRGEEARAVDREMQRILYGIYGGEAIACWLTGLKYYMVRRGLFASTTSFLGYPITDECRAFIERYVAEGALVGA